MKSSDIRAPLVLGDPGENFFLSSGHFLALPFASCKINDMINNFLLNFKNKT